MYTNKNNNSFQNKLKTMHNRSETSIYGQFEPIKLDPCFPITFPMFTMPPALPHIHNCFEIGFCYKGGGVFMIEDKIFPCFPGQAVFINKHEFHMLRDATPRNSRWKFINLNPVELLLSHVLPDNNYLNLRILSGPEFKNVIGPADNQIIPELVKDLINELETQGPCYKESAVALVWLLLVKLHRHAPDREYEPEIYYSKERIVPALQHIAINYRKCISINKLANLCNCSLSNFRRIFTQAMNCAPQQYLIRFRLNIAAVLLKNSNKQILNIAEETGFPTLSNFNRQFKETFRISPRQLRKQNY